MGQNIFTTQVPAVNGNDNIDYTLGTLFIADVDGVINGIRWFTPNQSEAGRVQGLYRYDSESSGTLLATDPFVTTIDSAWNYTPFSSPPAILAGQPYVACMYIPRRYVATTGLLTSAIVNGDLTAPADVATVPKRRNGRLISGQGGLSFPNVDFGGNCYFIDVDFTASAPATQPGRWGVRI